MAALMGFGNDEQPPPQQQNLRSFPLQLLQVSGKEVYSFVQCNITEVSKP